MKALRLLAKLRPRKIALFLLLGVLTTILTTGALELLSPTPRTPFSSGASFAGKNYSVYVFRRFGMEHRAVHHGSNVLSTGDFLWGSLEDHDVKDPSGFTVLGEGTRTSRGWPFLCVFGTVVSDGEPWVGKIITRAFITVDQKSAFPTGSWPYYPHWVGLLGNIAFYAALWWVLLFGVCALRTARRIRRNHCILCNYSLVGLPPNSPCPECGTMPTPRKPAPD